jgi:hypothetical protein
MFQAIRDKTAELREKAKRRVSDAQEKGRRLRENVETATGVDKARERYAQVDPDRCFPPRHPPHCRPWFLELYGIT